MAIVVSLVVLLFAYRNARPSFWAEDAGDDNGAGVDEDKEIDQIETDGASKA